MTFLQSAALCELVREFFKAGHKNNNKRYDLDEIGDLGRPDLETKALARGAAANKSSQYRPTPASANSPGFGDCAELALHLLHMGSNNVSGNCGEMAVMSAYFAMEKYSAKASELRMGIIKNPGDHVFCLIGVPANARADYNTVREFTQSDLAKKTFIVDPWLNTACLASLYLQYAKMRLEKWQREGKRISWLGKNGRIPGYYSPLGDYANVFTDRAPLVLSPFSGFKDY